MPSLCKNASVAGFLYILSPLFGHRAPHFIPNPSIVHGNGDFG